MALPPRNIETSNGEQIAVVGAWIANPEEIAGGGSGGGSGNWVEGLTPPAASVIAESQTSQSLFPARDENGPRKGWFFQNQSDADMWLAVGDDAEIENSATSFVVAPGQLYEAPVVTDEAINVICATANASFYARDW